MRIRTIKPEFWASEDIARLSWSARLLFIGLWSYVDDNGVGRDNERLIIAELFPLEDDPRETLASVSRDLQTLAAGNLIVRYTVESRSYLAVVTWNEHQRIDRPNRGRYPCAPPLTCTSRDPRETLATVSRRSRAICAPGTEEQRNRGTEESSLTRARLTPTADTQTAKTRRATPAPEDLTITESMRDWGRQHAPLIDGTKQTRQFLDHHRAKGSVFKDWTAAWRTWMGNAQSYAERDRSAAGIVVNADPATEWKRMTR